MGSSDDKATISNFYGMADSSNIKLSSEDPI